MQVCNTPEICQAHSQHPPHSAVPLEKTPSLTWLCMQLTHKKTIMIANHCIWRPALFHLQWRRDNLSCLKWLELWLERPLGWCRPSIWVCLGTIHILLMHIFSLFWHPSSYISMFLIMTISKNCQYLTSFPPWRSVNLRINFWCLQISQNVNLFWLISALTSKMDQIKKIINNH